VTTATRADHPPGAALERAGHLVYGPAVAGFGVLCLIAGDLGYVFQPVPRWMPLQAWLAYASGAVMLAGGLALLARATMRRAAVVLAIHFAVWLLVLNLPNALGKPGVIGNWEGCGLNMMVLAGAWLLLARSEPLPAGRAARLFGASGVRLARSVYAAGAPLVGLAHFLNAREATVYVPAWFPLQIGWVYLTGAAHIAAGLAILFGVLPGLAAVLEAAQITGFVLIAHVPAVYDAPRDRVQWAQLVYAVAIAAAAWLVAATYGGDRRRGPPAQRMARPS
jgi:uncharacterized membrane protein